MQLQTRMHAYGYYNSRNSESDDEIASTQDDINGVLNELLVKTIVATPPVSYIIISCIVLLP